MSKNKMIGSRGERPVGKCMCHISELAGACEACPLTEWSVLTADMPQG